MVLLFIGGWRLTTCRSPLQLCLPIFLWRLRLCRLLSPRFCPCWGFLVKLVKHHPFIIILINYLYINKSICTHFTIIFIVVLIVLSLCHIEYHNDEHGKAYPFHTSCHCCSISTGIFYPLLSFKIGNCGLANVIQDVIFSNLMRFYFVVFVVMIISQYRNIL